MGYFEKNKDYLKNEELNTPVYKDNIKFQLKSGEKKYKALL